MRLPVSNFYLNW